MLPTLPVWKRFIEDKLRTMRERKTLPIGRHAVEYSILVAYLLNSAVPVPINVRLFMDAIQYQISFDGLFAAAYKPQQLHNPREARKGI